MLLPGCSNFNRYPLDDVDEPNLIRDIFPYHQPPRIRFTSNDPTPVDLNPPTPWDSRNPPSLCGSQNLSSPCATPNSASACGTRNPPSPRGRGQGEGEGREVSASSLNTTNSTFETFYITDSTFRDGRQARPPCTPEWTGRIFDLLHRITPREGLIRQSEFFLYTKQDRQCLDLCRSRGYAYPEITGWVRASVKDLKLVRDAGLQETGILTSASDYHIFLKLGSTRQKTLVEYLDVVSTALDWGIVPRCSFEDVTRADVYGFCIPFAVQLMRLREQSGVDVKIRLCDTLGLGVPYPGAALPRSVPALIRAFIVDAGVPGRLLEWHGHNDFHKALINTATAWLYGCTGASGTLLGLGERTGNCSVEELLDEYGALSGAPRITDRSVVKQIVACFHEELGANLPLEKLRLLQ